MAIPSEFDGGGVCEGGDCGVQLGPSSHLKTHSGEKAKSWGARV